MRKCATENIVEYRQLVVLACHYNHYHNHDKFIVEIFRVSWTLGLRPSILGLTKPYLIQMHFLKGKPTSKHWLFRPYQSNSTTFTIQYMYSMLFQFNPTHLLSLHNPTKQRTKDHYNRKQHTENNNTKQHTAQYYTAITQRKKSPVSAQNIITRYITQHHVFLQHPGSWNPPLKTIHHKPFDWSPLITKYYLHNGLVKGFFIGWW